MVDHEHASHYTADMFMAPASAVAFFPAYHHFAIPWHEHDFYELGIVESGSGLHVSATGTEPFRRGTVVLVPPGAGHEYRSCVDMRVLNCFFRAELDELELAWAFRDAGPAPPVQPDRPRHAAERAPGRRPAARRDRARADARRAGGAPVAPRGTADAAHGAGPPARRAGLRGRGRGVAGGPPGPAGHLAARRPGVPAARERSSPIPGPSRS